MSLPSRAELAARAAKLSFDVQAFIDGKFMNALSGETFSTINPATGVELARVAACDTSYTIRCLRMGPMWSR
jgi:4-(gamma-glutamylamino)butanal dehydrogenase